MNEDAVYLFLKCKDVKTLRNNLRREDIRKRLMACEDLRHMISEITKLQVKRETGFSSVLDMAEIKKQSSVQSKCCLGHD
jgi:hypothetical protein